MTLPRRKTLFGHFSGNPLPFVKTEVKKALQYLFLNRFVMKITAADASNDGSDDASDDVSDDVAHR